MYILLPCPPFFTLLLPLLLLYPPALPPSSSSPFSFPSLMLHYIHSYSLVTRAGDTCYDMHITILLLINLAPPMRERGSTIHRVFVCLCVHYRSSGRSGYLMSQKKVLTESARRNEQNQPRDFAKNVLFKSHDSFELTTKTLLGAYATKSKSAGH